MSVDDDYQMVDAGASRPSQRVDHLRSMLTDAARKEAVTRTRRAESSAKAMEAILFAQAEEAASATTIEIDGVMMTSEDYRSRLLVTLSDLKSVRGELEQVLEQQRLDSDNIDSLQTSLERLHALVAAYRKDKDESDSELTSLLEAARTSFGDNSLSLSAFKELVASGQLGQADGRAELEAQLSQWAEWSENITVELAERDDLLKTREEEIERLLAASAVETHSTQAALQHAKAASQSAQTELAEAKEALQMSHTELSDARTALAQAEAEISDAKSRLISIRQELAEALVALETAQSDLAVIKRKFEEASKQLETINTETADQKSLIQEMTQKLEDWNTWAEAVTRDRESDAVQIAQLETQLGEKAQECQQLVTQLAAVPESLGATLEVDTELPAKLTAVEQALATTQAQLDGLKAATVENEKLRSGELSAMRQQLELAESSAQLDAGVKSAEIELLKRELLEAQETAAAKAKVIEDLQFDLELAQAGAQSTDRLEEVEAALAEKQAELDDLRAELSTVSADAALASVSLAEKTKIIEDLRFELELAQTQPLAQTEPSGSQELVEAKAELERVRRELSAFKGINEVLAAREQEIDSLQAEVSEVKARLSAQVEESIHLKAELASAERDEGTIELERLAQELSKRDKLIEDLRFDLDLAQSVGPETVSAEELERLRSAVVGKEEEIRALQERLQSQPVPESSGEQTELINEMETKLSEWAVWADQMTAELLEKEDQLSIVTDQLAAAKAETTALTDELSAAKSELAEAMDESRVVSENLEAPKLQLRRALEDLAKAQALSASPLSEANVDEAMAEKDNEIAELNVRVAESLAAVARLETELENSSSLVLKLRTQLSVAEAQAAAAKDDDPKLDFDLLNQQIEALRAELAAANSTIASVNDQAIASKDDQATSTSDQLGELEVKLAEWADWGASMTDELRARDASIEDLQKQMDAATEDRERLKAELEAVSDTLAETRLQNESPAPKALEAELRILQEENGLLKLQVESLSNSLSDTSPRAAEEKLREWEVWAQEVTATLAERDQLIESLQQREQTSELAAALSYMTTERDAALSRLSAVEEERRQRPAAAEDETEGELMKLKSQLIVREATIKSLIAQASPVPPEPAPAGPELAVAHEEIEMLKEKIAELIQRRDSEDVHRVAEEEASTLLTAYRAEIDRLSRENSEMRAKLLRSPTSGSWWKAPFMAEETPGVSRSPSSQ